MVESIPISVPLVIPSPTQSLPMSSISIYHQTLFNHISSLLSQLPQPSSASACESSSLETARAAREEEFRKAWDAEGHARHLALPKEFKLKLNAVAGSSSSRRTAGGEGPLDLRGDACSSSERRERTARRAERNQRKIEQWRARMAVMNLASPSIPPTPLLPAHATAYFPQISRTLSKTPKPAATSVERERERAALERQINLRLSATASTVHAGALADKVCDQEVLDSLAHCLGLVTDLGKVPEAVRLAKRKASVEKQQATIRLL